MLAIAIIDQYVFMRKGLSLMLENQYPNASIIECGSIREFLASDHEVVFDLIIVSVSAKLSMNSLQDIEAARAYFKAVPWIFFGNQNNLKLAISFFKMGIRGYLLKESIGNELIKCIDTILTGKLYLSSEMIDALINSHQLKTTFKVRTKELTSRETEISTYLLQGMKTSAIARILDVKASTVSSIKNSIFRKMSVNNLIDLQARMKRNEI